MVGFDYRTLDSVPPPDRPAFVRIYEEAFPKSERDAPDAVLDSISTGRRLCHVVYTSGQLVGLAVLLPLSVRGVLFLEYFAIDLSFRDQGIGTALLKRVGDESRLRKPSPPGILFEVESPSGAAGVEVRQRLRRIDFYRRAGARVVDCAQSYRAPNLEADGTIPYLLMWLPLSHEIASLQGDLLRALVRAVLTESYELGDNDPLLRQVLTELKC